MYRFGALPKASKSEGMICDQVCLAVKATSCPVQLTELRNEGGRGVCFCLWTLTPLGRLVSNHL